jgi:hypothetical protein
VVIVPPTLGLPVVDGDPIVAAGRTVFFAGEVT